MKRIILSLALGVLLMNLTSGCNQSSDTATNPGTNSPSATNSPSTNSPATNAAH